LRFPDGMAFLVEAAQAADAQPDNFEQDGLPFMH
jgi:hypothetical protein